ncbi:MAG: PAS domain-containing protein [Spirochaetales bacterium]|nr:PAS domain-containing protein [Spirochaetales bacterium]
MHDRITDFLEILYGEKTNRNLYESGFFAADFINKYSSLSKPLRNIGLSGEDMMNNRFVGKIHSDDLESYLQGLKRLHQGKDENLFVEYRIADREGNWHWILTLATVISRSSDDRVEKIFGFDRDITSEKELRDLQVRGIHLEKAGRAALEFGGTSESLEELREMLNFDQSEIYLYRNGRCEIIRSYPDDEQEYTLSSEKLFQMLIGSIFPVVFEDLPGESGFKTLIAAPVYYFQKLVGMTAFYFRQKKIFSDTSFNTVRFFSEMLSLPLEVLLRKETRQKELDFYIDQTQKELARTLHDGISQNLALSKMLINQIMKKRDSEKVKDEILNHIHSLLSSAIDEIRNLADSKRNFPMRFLLFPFLGETASAMEETFRIPVRLKKTASETITLEWSQKEHIYRIIQEAVSNAVRHGEAASVTIRAEAKDKELLLAIENDGVNPDFIKPGMGLTGIRERLEILGGYIIWHRGGNGAPFTLEMIIPLS